MGNESLKSKFPRLFSLKGSKKASLDCVGLGLTMGGSGIWFGEGVFLSERRTRSISF